MRRWQKILFGILLLILLSQLPFAYRRRRLAQLHTTIQQLNTQRNASIANPEFSDYREYKGVVHVHSFLGGHSAGNFQQIIDAAKANQLDFVVMTEHTERDVNTAAMTLKGVNAGILFLNGNEVSVKDTGRVLQFPGVDVPMDAPGLTVVAYPQEFVGWEGSVYDGVEVYNVYSNARQINPLVMFFDGLWSYRSYPELLFANFYTRPDENLRLWDQAMGSSTKRLTALAGNDAHANVGIELHDASGKTLLGLQLDPYERSFRLVRVHSLLPSGQQLSSETLLAALREGHCFIGFDLFSDSTGFRFTGNNGKETRIQGEELHLTGAARLTVVAPLPSRIVLIKNGTVVQEQRDKNRAEFVIHEPGAYRCEVYLPQLPHPVREQPWIISNPIYVR